jgi:hypothetical protein
MAVCVAGSHAQTSSRSELFFRDVPLCEMVAGLLAAFSVTKCLLHVVQTSTPHMLASVEVALRGLVTSRDVVLAPQELLRSLA